MGCTFENVPTVAYYFIVGGISNCSFKKCYRCLAGSRVYQSYPIRVEKCRYFLIGGDRLTQLALANTAPDPGPAEAVSATYIDTLNTPLYYYGGEHISFVPSDWALSVSQDRSSAGLKPGYAPVTIMRGNSQGVMTYLSGVTTLSDANYLVTGANATGYSDKGYAYISYGTNLISSDGQKTWARGFDALFGTSLTDVDRGNTRGESLRGAPDPLANLEDDQPDPKWLLEECGEQAVD